MNADVILLSYKRAHELVNDEHLMSGSIELFNENEKLEDQYVFGEVSFARMMSAVSERLRQHREAKVVIHRLENSALHPIILGDEMRALLRDDPVAAIRTMHVKRGQRAMEAQPVLRSGFDTLSDAFGERIYLRLQSGMAEDPLTGKMLTLAYGEKSGWRIRGDKDDWQSWLPIEMPGAPNTMDGGELTDFLVTARWATVSVADLLATSESKFFLPRRWNPDGQWVTREALSERLEKFNKEKQS